MFERFTDWYAVRFRELDANPFPAAAEDVVAERDLGVDPDRWAEALIATEREATCVHDDVRTTVERLAREHQIAVVTQGWPPVQRWMPRAVDLDALAEAVVTPVEGGPSSRTPRCCGQGPTGWPPTRSWPSATASRTTSSRRTRPDTRSVLYRDKHERADACLDGPAAFDRLVALV